MRSTPPGMGTPYPLVSLMPAPFQDDEFTPRFTAGLDEVIAPVISTLDCLHAYIDPRLTPVDFLDWMAGWVGITLSADWPLERRRAAVARAVPLYRMRGTVEGLREHVEVLTGGQVEVVDGGGVTWSVAPGGDSDEPPAPELHLLVQVTGPDPGADDPDVIGEIVAAAKPAHVPHRVEVLAG